MAIREFIGISLSCGLCACAVEPSDACRAYVACQEAYDLATGTGPVEVAQYRAGGACWDSAANAATCTGDCEAAVPALAAAADSEGLELPACQAP